MIEKWRLLIHVWLCDSLDCIAKQAPLSMGFSRQEYWSELSFPSPAKDQTQFSYTAGRFFTIYATNLFGIFSYR